MWEHKVEEFSEDKEDLTSFLNTFGEENWQLVTLMPASWVNAQDETMQEQLSYSGPLAVFKRRG